MPDEQGCNFVLWAPDAERIELCLFDKKSRKLLVSDCVNVAVIFGMVCSRRQVWCLYMVIVCMGHSPEQGTFYSTHKIIVRSLRQSLSRIGME